MSVSLNTIRMPSLISLMKGTTATLIAAGAGIEGAQIYNRYFTYKMIGAELAGARAQVESRVKRKAKGKSVVFHYTTRAGAIGISACQCVKTTSFRGKTVDGLSRPNGAYATSIPPWATGMTQSTISQAFYGGTNSRVGKLGWFVAIDAGPFIPYGQPGEFFKPATPYFNPFVSVDVITIGPNPMPLFD
ncbi:hypothetical protein [Rheinheimera baltica]|nr:hypothetical protein [Rheinheimera baltica]MDP5148602.1 hypothetical protein [Rheinheimera baltica]